MHFFVGLAIYTLPFTAPALLEGLFIPKSEGIETWAAFDPASATKIDHTPWQQFLDRYLDARHESGVWRVHYGDVSPADRAALDGYLDSLGQTDPRRLNKNEQMAFWINLYNAYTVAIILDAPGIESIREIKPRLFSIGPWNHPFIAVADHLMSLNDIEHGVLRPYLDDPRIHFAVNCASIGCPNLRALAYTGDHLEQALSAAASEYIAHRRGARFDDDVLVLSSLFSWYAEDFGESRRARLHRIASWADPGLARQIREHEGRIRYEYDWRLNAP
jgi:hypothetical protein